MNEWITDRLPTAEDALEDTVLVWNGSEAILWTYDGVEKGQPWAPIHKLIAPYVKPKRWTVESVNGYWRLRYLGVEMMTLTTLDWHHAEAAQRIADIYNKVKPCR
jgi:hypothetical protein